MIRIVTFKWAPQKGGHPRKGQTFRFGANHVNRLYNMLKRNIRVPFKLYCITDDPTGLEPAIRKIKLWDDYKEMRGCFRRLKMFSEEMKTIIGDDFFWIDLDVVIVKDITELLHEIQEKYDFCMWGDTHATTPYNGSFGYMKTGARKQVWEQFTPEKAEGMRHKYGYVGTDQAWIGVCLGEDEHKLIKEDGLFSYRVHFKQENRYTLNGKEKIIFFHGSSDPSKMDTQSQARWVREHWQ